MLIAVARCRVTYHDNGNILQADMLMECVKFGTVMRVATPESPGYFGSVCITFDASSGADDCARAMHGR